VDIQRGQAHYHVPNAVELLKTVKLSQASWLAIYNDIAKHHPHSVLLIRSKMRRVLGFTSRTHSEWDAGVVNRIEQINLDFFSENKYTMFILKYSEYLHEQ
jgi:hypothetical protein